MKYINFVNVSVAKLDQLEQPIDKINARVETKNWKMNVIWHTIQWYKTRHAVHKQRNGKIKTIKNNNLIVNVLSDQFSDITAILAGIKTKTRESSAKADDLVGRSLIFYRVSEAQHKNCEQLVRQVI